MTTLSYHFLLSRSRLDRVQANVSLVDLERVHLANNQVRPVRDNFPVDPYLHFAVVASHCVQLHHLLVAVPAISLRQKVGQWIKVWICAREPVSVRIPMIAPLLVLKRGVGVVVQPAGWRFALDVVILDEQDEEIIAGRRLPCSGLLPPPI